MKHAFTKARRPDWRGGVLSFFLFVPACSAPSETDTMADSTFDDKLAYETIEPDNWPRVRPPLAEEEALESRVDEILARMTTEHKVGQIIQGDIASVTPDDVRAYHLGSILNGGNSAPDGDLRSSPETWLALADAFWEASMSNDGPGVPVMWGTDAVHGHTNIVGATVFPHNIGLGAADDPALVRRIGEATALEISTTGLDWTFAPTLAVTEDVRWGRTYESYSQDPARVAVLGAELVKGLQGEPGTDDFLGEGKVIATAKHFVGDGGTLDGRDQGETVATEEELRDIHAPGYVAALDAGVQSIMASFSSWRGRKMHGRRDLLNDLLKDHWAFDGIVVGDWNGHGQIEGCSAEDCPDAALAGLDMYMAPDSWKALYGSTLAHVKEGRIPMARLDDAVRRILRVKLRAGLLDKPKPSERQFAGEWSLLGGGDHIDLAREAVRKSAVLLKNNNDALPLNPDRKILVVGHAADDLSALSGGWTLSWQGEGVARDDFPGSETLLDGVRRVVSAAGGNVAFSPDGAWSEKPDAAIFVFGEAPYAEFRGDVATLDFKPGDNRDLDILRRLQDAGVPTVSIFLSGRPLWINPELNKSDAFVAAFLPGAQSGALADILFTTEEAAAQNDFTGRLPFSWPMNADQYHPDENDPENSPLFPYRYGLTYADDEIIPILSENIVETEVDASVLFDRGVALGGWEMLLADEAGATPYSAGAQSPAGALSATPADLGQQENAIRLTWTGGGPAYFRMQRAPIDLSREANAAFELVIDYAVETPPAGAAALAFTCGESCATAFDIGASLQPSDYGGVSSLSVPLKCLAENAVDLSKVDTFTIGTEHPMTIVISRISVVPGMQQSKCPATIEH